MTAAILWAAQQTDPLTPAERSVLMAIARNATKRRVDGRTVWEAMVPVDAIAEDAGVSTRRAYDYLDCLVTKGVVVREANERHPHRPRYCYRLATP